MNLNMNQYPGYLLDNNGSLLSLERREIRAGVLLVKVPIEELSDATMYYKHILPYVYAIDLSWLTFAGAFMFADASINNKAVFTLPYFAAICRGV